MTDFDHSYLLFISFSDGEGKKRTSTICSSESLNAAGATLTPRRISWRRRIFLQVASPMNKSPSKMQHPGLCVLLKKINKQLLLSSYYYCEWQYVKIWKGEGDQLDAIFFLESH